MARKHGMASNCDIMMGVRLPIHMVKEIERVSERLEKNAPKWMVVKKSDALRYLLKLGIESWKELENEGNEFPDWFREIMTRLDQEGKKKK